VEPTRIGVAAGGVTVRDKRSRLKRTGASPVAGDREIAGVSSGQFRRDASSSAKNSLRLRVSAPLRLCVVSGAGGICVYLCDLWAFCRVRAESA